jgi:hypothetical protein
MHIYIPLKGYYPRYITHASSCIKGADIANVSDYSGITIHRVHPK